MQLETGDCVVNEGNRSDPTESQEQMDIRWISLRWSRWISLSKEGWKYFLG
jgi:hypothetical protein